MSYYICLGRTLCSGQNRDSPTMNSVNVAAFRQSYNHLFTLANVAYHACVGESEIRNWKIVASRILNEVKLNSCSRAKPYDLEQYSSAIACLETTLIKADERLERLNADRPKRLPSLHRAANDPHPATH